MQQRVCGMCVHVCLCTSDWLQSDQFLWTPLQPPEECLALLMSLHGLLGLSVSKNFPSFNSSPSSQIRVKLKYPSTPSYQYHIAAFVGTAFDIHLETNACTFQKAHPETLTHIERLLDLIDIFCFGRYPVYTDCFRLWKWRLNLEHGLLRRIKCFRNCKHIMR